MDYSSQQSKDKPVVLNADSFAKKNPFKFSIVNPKLLGLITVLLLMIGGVGTGVYLVQTRQQTTTKASLSTVDLSFKPTEVVTNVGSEFSVDIYASTNENQVTGTTLKINYNAQALELKSLNPGQLLPTIGSGPNIASGSASVSLLSINPSSGNGVIATAVFKALSAQATATKISLDPSQTQIAALGKDGDVKGTLGEAAVTINSASTVQPSPSSTSVNPQPSSSPIISSEYDFNKDGSVNTLDLSIMYSGWGSPKTDQQRNADLNKDGVVNGLDFSRFVPHYQ